MIKVSTGHMTTDAPHEHKNTTTISTSVHRPTQYIVAQANQSACWQFNKFLVISLRLPSVLIATLFSLAGAWLILPFIGAALCMVC